MRRVLAWVFSVTFALAAGCASKDTTTPPVACSSGICGSGGGSTGATGPGPGPTTTSGGGCAESWSCTPWNKGADGMYSRSCTDAAACGTTAQKPSEGPVALPELDVDYYKCNVEPILDGSCAMLGCHGVEQGRALKIYARGRLRHKEMVAQVSSCPIGPQTLDLAAMGTGTVMCIGWRPHTAAEWQENYDTARSFMVGLSDPEQSDLLAQPVYGGKAHAGVHLFAKTDADYTTIKAWLGGAKLGMACDPGAN